jgi:hypothetical protein
MPMTMAGAAATPATARLRRTHDQGGQEILALPQGFSYLTFNKNDSPMLDNMGSVPGAHDGMAAFRGPHGPCA